MAEILKYEVYYRIKVKVDDDYLTKGKLVVKARDVTQAKERAILKITNVLNINSIDLDILDVIFWDVEYN